MNTLSFSIHGNADGHNELLEMLINLLSIFDSSTMGSATGGTFLDGIGSLTNIHPLLVHFPIAFLSLFVVMDVMGTLAKKTEWRELAGRLLYFGTAFAVVTVWAGMRAAETIPHGHNVHEIMARHEHLGISILALSTALTAWRLRRSVDGFGLYSILSLILAGVLICGADLGGLMVYKYGVAVQAVSISPEESHQHE